jgi:ribosomal-protein-alanine N-acetyltransferase
LIEKNEENIEAIRKIEYEAFNENILNNWSIVPYIRYGCALGLFTRSSLKGLVIFMRAWDDPKLAYLVEIAMGRESQGKGYGYYLLSQSLLHLKKNGFSTVALTVDPDNLRARHIYCEKLGFEFVEYRKNEYGQGRNRLFLKLDLEKWSQ